MFQIPGYKLYPPFYPGSCGDNGSLGPGATHFIEVFGRRLFVATQDQRSASFLRQRVDMAIKRGNALSVFGTFPSGSTDADLSFGV